MCGFDLAYQGRSTHVGAARAKCACFPWYAKGKRHTWLGRDWNAALELAVEQLRRRARGVEPAGHHLVEELLDGGILAHRLLELAAQAVGRERHHLVHEVAAAALLERALLADVLAVLGDSLGHLDNAHPLRGLGL